MEGHLARGVPFLFALSQRRRGLRPYRQTHPPITRFARVQRYRWLPAVLAACLSSSLSLSDVPPAAAAGPQGVLPAPCPPLATPKSDGVRSFRSPGSPEVVARDIYTPEATPSWSIDDAPEVTAMSGTVASVLAFNAIRFGEGTDSLYSFLPGELYQEVYGRDLLTASRAAQYLYGDAFLRSGVERFLERQHATLSPRAEFSRAPYPSPGALHGLLKRDGSGEKTTAVSDEEGSIIQLAYLYYQLQGGPAWLSCELAGKPVIERLNRAADALLHGRVHPATGLLKRSHTTDWGDVRMQGGLAVTEAPPLGETWTASIYDQAWMYQALLELAEMNQEAGLAQPAQRFREEAARLKDATNRLLWMPERGYYRIHLHLTTFEHDFDEDAMVAIGNAVAVYAGLADERQARSVFAALEQARVRAGSLKPGLSVYPPYHEGFFRHDLQYESGRYQNGGQWDWWGGVQVTAEFEAGHSALAWQHLAAIARDWADHPNDVAEWQVPRTNRMEGSHQYAGAAGTVAEAVVRGVFGAQMTAQGFSIESRLGERNAFLALNQPASGRALWYRQRTLDNAVVLQYRASGGQPGRVAVLLPEGKTVATVALDGAIRPHEVYRVGNDRYAALEGLPAGAHTLHLTLTPDVAPLPPAPAASLAVVGPADRAVVDAWPVAGLAKAGAVADLGFTLRNMTATPWQRPRLVSRWFSPDGAPYTEPGLAPAEQVLRPVAAGQSAYAPIALRTPQRIGAYRVSLELTDGGRPVALAGPELFDVSVVP